MILPNNAILPREEEEKTIGKAIFKPARDRLNELYIERQREVGRPTIRTEIESCQVLALVDLLEERGLL